MGEEFYSPVRTMARRDELQPLEFYEERGLEDWYGVSLIFSRIMYNLMELPEFQEEVKTVYREQMAGRCEELAKVLNVRATEIATAAQADEKRWNKEGFDGEVERLMEWLRARCKFFEKEYGGESYTVE